MTWIAPVMLLHTHNRGYSPSRPPTRGGRIFLTCLAIVVAAGLIVAGIAAVKWTKQWNAGKDAAQHSWDAGTSRPAAATIQPGATQAVPPTVGEISEYWDTCTHKSCYSRHISHYPQVFPIVALQFKENCYVDTSDNGASHIKAAANAGGYTVAFSSDGHKITICAPSNRRDDDHLVIWSDDPSAAR